MNRYGGFRNFGLKRKALGIFLLFIILPTFGVGVIVQHQFNEALQDQFISSTRRNLDTVTAQLSEQTKMVEDIADYMILNPDMRAFLQPYPALTPAQLENRKRNIEGFLTFQLISKSYIRSIVINGYNGNNILMGEPFSGSEQSWIRQAEARRGGIVWSTGYPLHSDWAGETQLISLFRIINSYDEITRPLGRLIVRMDEDSMVQLLDNGIFKDGGSVWLVNAQGHTVLSAGQPLPESFTADPALADILSAGVDDQVTFPVLGKQEYLSFSRTIDTATGWHIVALIPHSKVNEGFQGIKWMMTLILGAILLLSLSALIGFHFTIIRPILELKRETNRVSRGDFHASVAIRSRDEIAELGRKFNEMVITIRELIDYKYRLELRQRESELKLLQEQVDPHFLYNTLDMIRWTARLEKAERSSQLIEMLSRFFRNGMTSKSYRSTLEQELELVRSYLYLQQHRLGGRLQYSLYTEAGLEQQLMLKATIQPLVENVIKHGLNRRQTINQIAVRCYRAEAEIHIDVIDNGKGMTPERLAEVQQLLGGQGDEQQRRGALCNIHDRLSIFFGTPYGLKVISSSPEGTWLRIVLPGESTNRMDGEYNATEYGS